MPNREPRKIIPSDGGFFQSLSIRFKLVLRLMADERVNPLLKLIPLASVLYLLIPDLLPGPVDDATVIGLGLYTFVELCPPEIVQEHLEDLTNVIPGRWQDVDDQGDVIDAEFREGD